MEVVHIPYSDHGSDTEKPDNDVDTDNLTLIIWHCRRHMKIAFSQSYIRIESKL